MQLKRISLKIILKYLPLQSNMNEDRFDVIWTSMWEEPIRFISVDTNVMQKLYKEGRNNQYKVEVYPRPLEEEACSS